MYLNIQKSFEECQEYYFSNIQSFTDLDQDVELDFIISNLANVIFALRIITLDKDIADLIIDPQTRVFKTREAYSRLHVIGNDLIYLTNCNVPMEDLIDKVSNYDEKTKQFNEEEIKFILNTYYLENGKAWFKRKEWQKNVTTLSKFYRWLNKRKEKIRKDEPVDKKIEKNTIIPLDFNLNQTDLVHFFDLLVDADVIKEPTSEVHKNGGFYPKIAQYFTAKGKAINPKSAKVVKTNKENKGTTYSESFYSILQNLRDTINKKLNQ